MVQGSVIGDRYVLDCKIGEGGMASVWRARDRTLRRAVAIKFLWARERPGHQDLIKAFLREARIAASVHHANVVQVLDFGLHEEDVPYMVMEVLEGETLGDQFNNGAVYSMEQVVHIAAGTLEGLLAVHEAGIVHRDLKPENVFLVPQRNRLQPKLLDFGISRAVDRSTGLRSAVTTQEGRVIGTPEYMSPEQARGVGDIDGRTDIYSMGVILYEMIVGDVPYKAPHFGDLIIKIVKGDAAEVSELVPSVGKPVSDLIAKAMAKDPADRFQNAAQMYDALLLVAAPFGGTDAVMMNMPRRLERRRTNESVGLATTGDDLELVLAARSNVGLQTESSPPGAGQATPAVATTGPSAPADGDRSLLARSIPMVGVAAVVAAGFVAIAAMREPPAPVEPSFIVVQGTQSAAAPEPAAAVVEAEPPPVDPEPEPEIADDKPEPLPSKPNVRKKRAVPSRVQLLATAFRRQKSKVVRCFRTHGEAAETSISVRVQVDIAGIVQKAQVLPAAAARTPAGRCVEQAVRKMTFGQQPTPASFRVPLYVTRGTRPG